MNILEKYQLSFYEYSFLNSKKKGCRSEQNVIHHTLGIFISQIQDIDYIDATLTAVNNVLSSAWPEADACANDMIMAFIDPTTTKFCDVMGTPPDINNPDYVMPTTDFKEILIEWKAFLKKS